MNHTKTQKKKYTSGNTNTNICESANKYIKLLINTKKVSPNVHSKPCKTNTYAKYKNYVSTISHQFVNSHHTLLSSLFKIKNNTKFTITYTELSLTDSQTYSIPKIIDIFRYLIINHKNTRENNDFINNFTLEEQKILKDKLSIKVNIKKCYTFLDKSPLGNKLLSIYNSMSTSLLNDLLLKFPSLNFHRLLINGFTSYKILEDLETNIKKLIIYSILYEGTKLDNFVYLFTYDNINSIHTPEQILSLGQDIIKRILFFNKLLNTTLYPDKFIIFLTDNKKEIDKELKEHLHFKTINVNTAVTNGTDIIIYREQELLKSIFHELIHFHNLDFRHVSPDILNHIISYLIKTHNITENNEYLLYESITESLANILNNIYYSGTLNEMTNNLQNEILFSTLQISKILNICKYKTWNQFSNSDITNSKSNHLDKSKHFKQDSCVFSYYILKLYILLNLDNYFKKVLDSKMKFIQTKKSFDNLIEIFDSSRKNILLEQIINSILQGLNRKQKEKKEKTVSKEIHNTLRMTCL